MNEHRIKLWRGIVLFWIVQAVVVYYGCAYLFAAAQNVSGPDRLWGHPTWADMGRALTNSQFAQWTIGSCGVIIVAQALFLLPVRRPGAGAGPSKALWLSLGIAGLGLAVLAGAMMLAVWYTLDLYTSSGGGIPTTLIIKILCICTAVSWCIATPLLIAFCKGGRRENLLQRVAGALFLGTIVEVAAIIPLDVLVRRKESCYCWAGTYIALLIAGGVGLVFLGPLILLPVLARRRRRWYAGRCECCGYDMSATLKADRCPECGAGWRTDVPLTAR